MATKAFQRGQFVVGYAGQLLSVSEAQAREAEYQEDPTIGSYMHFFEIAEERFW